MRLALAVKGSERNGRAFLALNAFQFAVTHRHADALSGTDTGVCSVGTCLEALVDKAGEQVGRRGLEFSHVR